MWTKINPWIGPALIAALVLHVADVLPPVIGAKDFPNGWATLIGAVIQVYVVWRVAHLGFAAQEHQARLAGAAAARSTAAPIQACLRQHERIYWSTILRNCHGFAEALPTLNPDPNYQSVITHEGFPKCSLALFDDQRSRLGELGAYVAHRLAGLYVELDERRRQEPHTYRCNPQQAKDRILWQVNALKRLCEAIEILSAVDALGLTDQFAIEAHLEAAPHNWPSITSLGIVLGYDSLAPLPADPLAPLT